MNTHGMTKAVLGALVAVMVGCGPSTDVEPGVMAAELLGDADDAAAEGAPLGSSRRHGRFIELARQCAPESAPATIDVCGRSVPGSAHVSWSNCTLSLPEGARAASLTTSGSLDVEAQVSGVCEDGTVRLTRTSQFLVDRAIAEGVSMHIEGSSTATRSVNGAQSVTFQISRNASRAGSTVAASGSISGQFEVSADAEGQRILNGTASFSMTNARFSKEGSIVLENVVRISREECKWPVGGTMTRSNGDETRVIVFSETCGQATIDGEPVDLDTQAAAFAGCGGRGCRPF